jgi:hypothetical protein
MASIIFFITSLLSKVPIYTNVIIVNFIIWFSQTKYKNLSITKSTPQKKKNLKNIFYKNDEKVAIFLKSKMLYLHNFIPLKTPSNFPIPLANMHLLQWILPS